MAKTRWSQFLHDQKGSGLSKHELALLYRKNQSMAIVPYQPLERVQYQEPIPIVMNAIEAQAAAMSPVAPVGRMRSTLGLQRYRRIRKRVNRLEAKDYLVHHPAFAHGRRIKMQTLKQEETILKHEITRHKQRLAQNKKVQTTLKKTRTLKPRTTRRVKRVRRIRRV